MSFTISNRVFGFTGTIITFLEGFDRELQFIKDDLSSLFIQTSSKGKDADLNFVLRFILDIFLPFLNYFTN